LCILIFVLCIWFKLIVHTITYYNQNAISVVAGFIIAQFLVDFISGMLHWACDTWGHFSTPFVGPTLIRSFRMHHVDPQDITKHGFIETNASSSYPAPLFIAIGLFLTPDDGIKQTYEWTIIFGVVLAILTNEIHKWSHLVHSKPHPIIRFLQNTRLILSHE
jgi:ubiquitin-conjugating enzyme E2 variant